MILWPSNEEAQARRLPAILFAFLLGTLLLTALTVNWIPLHEVSKNRFYTGVFQTWNRLGFRSFGLWFREEPPHYYQREGTEARLHAYSHSSTGAVLPAYVIDRFVIAVRGRTSGVAVQGYSQLVVLISALFVGLLGLRAALREPVTPKIAGAFALSAALVYQNFLYHLEMAREIIPTAVSVMLMMFVFWLRDIKPERGPAPQRTIDLFTAGAMFWIGLSDLVIVPGFFALAVGLLSFYGITEPLPMKKWAKVFLLPVLCAFAVLQLQLALGRGFLGIASLGTPELTRMGLNGLDPYGLGGHRMILTFLRDRYQWWGLATLAILGLIAVLIRYRHPGDRVGSRALLPILAPIVTYLCLAAAFSELVLIHPYTYDLLLIGPAVLVVFVQVPLILARLYPHHGVLALAVLLFSMMYVWISIVDYAIMLQRLKASG